MRATISRAADAHLPLPRTGRCHRDGERGKAYSAVEDEAHGKAFVERGHRTTAARRRKCIRPLQLTEGAPKAGPFSRLVVGEMVNRVD
jgi:hypothetical protein